MASRSRVLIQKTGRSDKRRAFRIEPDGAGLGLAEILARRRW